MVDANRQPGGLAWSRRGLVLLGVVLLGALLLALWPDSGAQGPSVSKPAPASTQLPAAAPAQALSVESGGTLELAMASLPSTPLAVDLMFPEPSTASAPLPVRIVAHDGRLLEMQARVSGDTRRRARIEIPPDWLSPGRYIVELKTTERSHFPLRRYALEVR